VDRHRLVARYDGRVPRYTSYPTALHFRPVSGEGWYRDWLSAIPADTGLSLYLHIPFCRTMCWYCGCNTRVAKDDGPVTSYVAALRREIALVGAAIGRRQPVARLHWGGGTPTLLPPDAFSEIVADLRRTFDLSAVVEHAVEVDPRALDDGRIGMLAQAGVDRASLGVQTLAPEVQARINRVQPMATVVAAVERLRAAGIRSLNFDLMYGLPGQSVEDVAATAAAVSALAPDRLALFGYAHVPWMKPHQQRIVEAELPGAVERFDQLIAGAAVLGGAGYRRIGLDHFVVPSDPLAVAAGNGTLRRNFQGYTDDPAAVLIGLGASAIGETSDGYVQNMAAVPDWRRSIFAGKLPVAKMRGLSREDRMRRETIGTLMCGWPLDVEMLLAAHDYAPDHLDGALARLSAAADDGVVTIAGRRVEITERGWPFMRSVAAAFDAYLAPDETRHARAV
jgi:oxygen-independent coproporphyrinogen III oxidase